MPPIQTCADRNYSLIPDRSASLQKRCAIAATQRSYFIQELEPRRMLSAIGSLRFPTAIAVDRQDETVGVPWTGPRGVVRTVADITAENSQQGTEGSGSLNATPGLSFTGATFSDGGVFPPDSMGDVGPTQYIVAVNNRLRSFNKTTGLADGALNSSPSIFFQSVMTPPLGSNFVSDPRIRYDRLSGRWFITMIDVPGGTGNVANNHQLKQFLLLLFPSRYRADCRLSNPGDRQQRALYRREHVQHFDVRLHRHQRIRRPQELCAQRRTDRRDDVQQSGNG